MTKKTDYESKLGDWLISMSDEQRADVIKTQIAEEEKTRRLRIEQEEESRRADIATDGYHGFRIGAICALVCAIAAGTCVGYRAVEAHDHNNTPPPTATPAPK